MSLKKHLGLLLLILSSCSQASECPQWNNTEAKSRITALAAEIWRHDILYHEQNKPQISDAEYDVLEWRLTHLQQCFPSVSARRYQPEAQSRSLQHVAFMGSLKKADDEGDVKAFLQKFSISGVILQPKIDGIAVELIYKKGRLIKAITRGDGDRGESIIDHVKPMALIPQELPEAIDLVLHGELFIRLDIVDKTILKKYTSARHLVAGQVNRKKPVLDALKTIDFFPWKWVDAPFASETDTINTLHKLGFKHPLKYTHNITTLKDVSSWRKIYANKKNDIFLMDGIVIKSASIADQKKAGSNQKHPDWALAWKFPAITAVTTVIDIEFSKGQTGKITPVLILTPVTIEGRNIQRVSLGSLNIFHSKNIAIGDQVSVMLKGAATPVFGRVILRGADRSMPED